MPKIVLRRLGFFHLSIAFLPIWHTQYTGYACGGVHRLFSRSIVAKILTTLSEIKQTPSSRTTCSHKLLKKKFQESANSVSTIAKEIENIFRSPSCATANNKTCLYLSYNHVPSTWTIRLQNGKPSIHGLNAQKSWWNICFP